MLRLSNGNISFWGSNFRLFLLWGSFCHTNVPFICSQHWPKWSNLLGESVCWVPPSFALAASIGECCPFQNRLCPCSKWLCYWGWVVCQDHWPALSLMQSIDWPGLYRTPHSVSLSPCAEWRCKCHLRPFWVWEGCCRVTAFYLILIHLISTPCSYISNESILCS